MSPVNLQEKIQCVSVECLGDDPVYLWRVFRRESCITLLSVLCIGSHLSLLSFWERIQRVSGECSGEDPACP